MYTAISLGNGNYQINQNIQEIDTLGNSVTITVSVGIFNLSMLQNEVVSFGNEVSKRNAMISAIQSLSTNTPTN